MLFATWNVNSLNARIERVTEWLEDVQPDVCCLQETKMADAAFPALRFKELGYDSVHVGEGRWNGVAILSRVGLEDAQFEFGTELSTDARIVGATCDGVKTYSVYVPNGRALDDDHYQFKLRWLAELKELLAKDLEAGVEVIVAGDWNVAREDRDVWDVEAFENSTHVTDAERNAIQELVDLGLVDVFRQEHDVEKLYSYYDYQAGRFHKREGMRIDYLLASEKLAEKSELNLVDRNARKGTKPSDHAPVLTYFG